MDPHEPQLSAEDIAAEASSAQQSVVPDDVPVRELGQSKVPYELLRYIPEESANHYQIVPLGMQDGVLEVGMLDPDDLAAVDALNFIARKTGVPYKVFRVSKEDIDSVIEMYHALGGDVGNTIEKMAPTSDSEKESKLSGHGEGAPLDLNAPAPDELEKKAGAKGNLAQNIREDAPAIKLVSTILRYAIDGKASDVHIEPNEKGVRVRYRVDGQLHTSVVLPPTAQRALVARVKVLSSIRLDEQRKPQDGRFSAEIEGRRIDFRVSTFPTYYGEKVVIRILDRQRGFRSLEDLGMEGENLRVIREAITQPHGLILISGPTGSGKSSTLYSMLAEVDREQKNVLSLEDPIEYNMDGVSQSQVRPEIGYTFANGLRTTLRQDPDVIMVGEIRDGETAKLAIQAALTGHLVLSTIHTNSAVGTIPRLIDMGVEPYMIPPTLILSMAQRLVRTLCPDSGTEMPISDSMHELIANELSTLPASVRPEIPGAVLEAQRSPSCPNGTRGRMAVFEMLPMTPQIERVILDRPIESHIWAAARKQGMLTMREDAMKKAFARQIPWSEVNTLSSALLSEDEEEMQEDSNAKDQKPAETTND